MATTGSPKTSPHSAIGGEDHGALLVAGIDGLEEQIAAAANGFWADNPSVASKLAGLPFSLGRNEREGDDRGKAGGRPASEERSDQELHDFFRNAQAGATGEELLPVGLGHSLLSRI